MQCKNCQKDLEVTEYVCTNCGNIIWENIIADAKEKKEDAIACLMEKTQNKLYYTVYRYVKNQGLAEDIVQETYIKALDSLDSLSDANKFESWITTIAVNRSKNYLGVKKNTEFVDFTSMEEEDSDLLFEESIENETMSFEPEANFNYSELKDSLNSVLDELPDNQRMAILLYYLDEFKVKEISEIMDIPQGSVKSLLNYGRTAIKKKIEELRKQNKSFYSIAAFPFLGWMLKDQVKSIKISAKMTDAIMKSVGVNQGINAAQTATSAKAITTAAAKGISTKVVAGVVAGVVTAGAIGGYVVANQSSQPEEPKEEVAVEEDDNTTKYSVLDVEVPDFEFAPIDNDGENGYLVKVDGLYGFIDSNGEFILDPTYEGVMFSDLDGTYGSGFDVCLFPSADQTGVQDGTSIDGMLGDGYSSTCGHGFGGMGSSNYLSVDNRVIGTDMSGMIFDAKFDEPIIVQKLTREFTDGAELYANASTSIDTDHYYIVTPELNVFGPYDNSESAVFSMNENTNQTQDIEKISGLFNSYVKGMFYEKVEDGYVVWNKEGTDSYEEVVDYAMPISNNAMKVKIDGKLGIINEDLELVLLGDFDDVSNVMDGNAYVKIDDEWKLIQLDEVKDTNNIDYSELISAYQAKVTEIYSSGDNENYYTDYSLYDIDQNGIPELMVKYGHCEADYMYDFYTYEDGMCVLLTSLSGGHSMLEVDPDQNGILLSTGHMGGQRIKRITLKGNVISEEDIFDSGSQEMEEYIYHEAIPYYSWDDMTGFEELEG